MKEKNNLFTIEKGCCPYYQDLVKTKKCSAHPPLGASARNWN